ncbi:MAG: ABC transporter permease [Chitinophagaceae bacterium]|nr:MAG: ABC transporter permease [Chitinophagaceae bacterium]
MFKNYFKTAWRNLVKNRFYSVITILGLTIGLTVGLLILFWVQDERNIDGFHKHADNIYKLENRVGTGDSRQIWTSTASAIGYLGITEVPAIRDMVRLTYDSYFSTFKVGTNKIFAESNIFTDPSLFTMFDFPLIQGNTDKPFPDDNSVVLTQSAAKKYFGDYDPMGKVIVADDSVNLTVTGIIADFPRNSAFNFNLMLPITILNRKYGKPGHSLSDNFEYFNYKTFLQLQPNTNLATLSTTLRNLHLRTKAEDTDVEYLFLPLRKAHLYKSDGSEDGITSVRMFTIIAIIILVIACINYVNLSTARSMLRAKEVSLRKIVGAAKTQLFAQFVVETAVVFIVATLLSLGLMALTMPFFNDISGKQLVFDLFNPQLWKVIGITIGCTLLVSSIYPALLLSSFDPLKAIKGVISVKLNDVFFRKSLVVTQFAFSVILIISTFVISRQLHYIQSKKLGLDKEHTFSFFVSPDNNFEAIRNDLAKSPVVTGVAKSNWLNIIDMSNQTGNNDYDGKPANSTFMVYPIAVDKDFIPFFKMELTEGSNFTNMPADSSHFILNETAIKTTGIKNPIGKRFRLWGIEGTIIGVVKDFHFASIKNKIEPAIFHYNGDKFGRLYVRTTAGHDKEALALAEQSWNRHNAGIPFGYAFLDENFSRLYTSEKTTGKLFNIFAGIAIFISCMGLLGLTAYTAQVRTKEIGVRKVLGASVPTIIRLLAKDFIRLVLIAILVASPIAWYAMNKWLGDFVYRVDIGWVVFVMSAGLSILIALVTISFQSVRAALANPIKSLRTD